MVRKSELTNATWSEIIFSEALWAIPKERMEPRNPNLVSVSTSVAFLHRVENLGWRCRIRSAVTLRLRFINDGCVIANFSHATENKYK